MAITLGKTSLSRLDGVHPDLARVVKRAALIGLPSQDFLVIQGVRTREECCVNWGKGRTIEQCISKGVPASYALPEAGKVTWLSDPFGSKHTQQKDGFGHACDLAPFPLDWNDLSRFQTMANVVKSAAQQEGVSIVWGGDWKTSKDYPHVELTR